MATTNERLRDRSVSHAIGLERLKTATVRRIIALLNRVDQDLVQEIQDRLDRVGIEDMTQARLNELLRAVRAINREGYIVVGAALTDELEALAGYEPEFQARMILDELPIRWDLNRPSAAQLRSVVHSRPFRGRLLREWVDGLRDSQFSRVRDAVRIGIVEGETLDQIVRRIRGTRRNRYADGILEIGRREAQAVVRTAVNHVATRAREALYAANADILKGVQWVSTLDSRTTPVCMARDGRVFPLDSGPRPPAHVGCRSGTSPVTRSARDLGIDLHEAPAGTRSSMNGQVPAATTYPDWLRRQSVEVQNEALGVERARLFRSGDLTIDQMVRQDGREWTLDELRRRERP